MANLAVVVVVVGNEANNMLSVLDEKFKVGQIVAGMLVSIAKGTTYMIDAYGNNLCTGTIRVKLPYII